MGYVKKDPTRRAAPRAIYDIYLWTRLRDRNLEEVKVGFVTYFSPTWKYLSSWRVAASRNFRPGVLSIDTGERKIYVQRT